MLHPPTVLATWSQAVLDALQDLDIDPNPIARAAGLDESSFSNPDARHAAQCTAILWREASRAARDPAFGLRVARHMGHTSCHALGFTVLASANLGDALTRIVRYQTIVQDACTLALRVDDSQAELVLTLRDGYARGADEQMDAGLALLVRTCRLLTRKKFPLRSVRMSRQPPRDPQPYLRYFGVPIEFGSDNALVFDPSVLEQKIANGNERLAHYNEHALDAYMRRGAEADVVARATVILEERLEQSVPIMELSKRLAMSVRSLQRALSLHGTSYEKLLNKVRMERARYLLERGNYSVTDVSGLTGYDHLSTFIRAFQRYHQCSPTTYMRGISAR